MTAIPSISKTPDDVAVEPRDLKFELKEALATDWLNNDPFLTAVFNAMSMSFPSGEKQFIDSVRYFEDRVTDEKLLGEIHGFYKQEAIHSREHRRYNKELCRQRGYDYTALEGVYLDIQQKTRENPDVTPEMMLASTAALEHFTASMAELVMNGYVMENTDKAVKDLWLWHSIEEMEHKAVAFDLYTLVGKGHTMRTRMMKISILVLLRNTLKVAFKMLHHDKQLWKWKTMKGLWKFFLGKEGFIRLYLPAHKEYFRRDFHPWDADTRPLLAHWQAELSLETISG